MLKDYILCNNFNILFSAIDILKTNERKNTVSQRNSGFRGKLSTSISREKKRNIIVAGSEEHSQQLLNTIVTKILCFIIFLFSYNQNRIISANLKNSWYLVARHTITTSIMLLDIWWHISGEGISRQETLVRSISIYDSR